MKKGTFKTGGVHPDPRKLTAGMPAVALDLPMRVELPLVQHIGAPAVPVVAKGERVKRFQCVGEASKGLSARVHTPISGVVKDVTDVSLPNGYTVKAVIIEASEEDHRADMAARAAQYDALSVASADVSGVSGDAIDAAIASAGVVGLGGATFPSVIKLKTRNKPDYLVVNGCECEPMLTCDDCLMRTFPSAVVGGVRLMMEACGAARALIGVEDNKPEAIRALRDAVEPQWNIDVVALRTKYPQGGEKQLIEALTGRRVPSGALPSAVGVVVNNVATALAVYMAVKDGTPLVERFVTVTGDVASRGNYIVAVGTPMSVLVDDAGDDAKVIVGGPMMGRAAVTLEAPVTKGTSGLVVVRGREALRRSVKPCIRCASCVDACPMGLEPYLLSTFGRLSMHEDAEKHRVTDCIECGSCSYICPSSRPLLDYIRQAKSNVQLIVKARNNSK